MSEAVKNAKTASKVYYGLHMVPGVAEYHTENFDGRIFIDEPTIKNMDPTFEGKPVYVEHVDKVDLDKLQEQADGFVIESFYNKLDGKHWAKFIIVSDAGHEAIAKGWRLSNAYFPKEFAGGGTWHAVEYEKEVMSGVYEHLALVPKPRYEESIILTPEEFKSYNTRKAQELERLSNSKETLPMFKLFSRQKVEDAEAKKLENLAVQLSNGKEITIAELVALAEKAPIANESAEAKEEEKEYANGEHMVKLGDKELSLNDLIKTHHELNSAHSALMAKNAEADAAKEKEAAEKNAADDEDKKKEEAKKNAADAEKEGVKAGHFDALKNAAQSSSKADAPNVDTDMDQLARGMARYGSR